MNAGGPLSVPSDTEKDVGSGMERERLVKGGDSSPLYHNVQTSACMHLPIGAASVQMLALKAKKGKFLDFDKVREVSLLFSQVLLEHWLPRGYTEQNGDTQEYVVRNPTRNDRNPGSFKINLHTGRWGEFAEDDSVGGDLITLKAYLDGGDITYPEAARRVVMDMLEIITTGQARPSGTYRQTQSTDIPTIPKVPQRRDYVPMPMALSELYHPALGKPDHIYPYFSATGRLEYVVCRWDKPHSKEIRPFSFQYDGTWKWKGPEYPLLYMYPNVFLNPRKPILIVEGEKTANAANRNLKEFVATTWSGGCNGWRRLVFPKFSDRDIVLWPDNDDPGITTMEAVKRHLENQVRTIAMVKLPPCLPEGYDLGDIDDSDAAGWEDARRRIQTALDFGDEYDDDDYKDW